MDSFWVQLDANVMDDAAMSAVDPCRPDGPQPDETSERPARLTAADGLLGMDATVRDPSLEPERRATRVRVDALAEELSAPAFPSCEHQSVGDGIASWFRSARRHRAGARCRQGRRATP